MEKITKKLIITLLISFLFLIIVHNNEVNAHSTEDIIEEIDIEATLASITEDEKIMEYNAITGETREVDMEQVKQSIAKSRNNEQNNSLKVDPIIFCNKTYQPKTAFNSIQRLR